MKLLFITDNFPPEVNAPATRTFEHCKEWIEKGVEVTVVTCAPNFPKGKVYEGYKNKLVQTEYIEGIKVIRVWSYITANEGFFKRVLDFLSFSVMAFWVCLFKKTDLIIATSPQFFTTWAAAGLSFIKRKPWVFELRDIWPESIKAVGAISGDSKIFKTLEKIELFLYKRSSLIVSVTESFKKNLIERGVPSEKIEVVRNGANLQRFKPVPKNKALVEKFGFENKFVVGYIGTHGMAHKLDFIVNAWKNMDESFHLLFMGDGAEKPKLVSLTKELGIRNITFLSSVPKDEVSDLLSVIDVALVPLKKSPLFKTVIPSKIFENAAMQIPILLGVEGESAGIVKKYNAGLCFEPENTQDFLDKVNLLKNDKVLFNALKEGGSKLAIDFDRKIMAAKMLDYLRRLIK